MSVSSLSLFIDIDKPLKPGLDIFIAKADKQADRLVVPLAEELASDDDAKTKVGIVDGATLTRDNDSYRVCNPFRSHLFAALVGGIELFPLRKKSRCLYVGPSLTGTASLLSDAVASSNGKVFAVATPGPLDAESELSEPPALAWQNCYSTERFAVVIPADDCRDIRSFESAARSFAGERLGFTDVIIDTEFKGCAGSSVKANHLDCMSVLSAMMPLLASTTEEVRVLVSVNGNPNRFAEVVQEMREAAFDIKPREQITLEPFFSEMACIIGVIKK